MLPEVIRSIAFVTVPLVRAIRTVEVLVADLTIF